MKKVEFKKIKIEYPSFDNIISSCFLVEVYYKINLFDFDFKSLGYNFPDYVESCVKYSIPIINPEISDIKISFLPVPLGNSILFSIFKDYLSEKQTRIFSKIINRKKAFFEDQLLKCKHESIQNNLKIALDTFNELNTNLTFKEYIEEFLANKDIKDILE